ncbi:hypothetical protein BC940DRAFT_328502 [Gongronella butleri]|nr:hypothetical protein BC940DRAFT_328502 [Gongronella butleri]
MHRPTDLNLSPVKYHQEKGTGDLTDVDHTEAPPFSGHRADSPPRPLKRAYQLEDTDDRPAVRIRSRADAWVRPSRIDSSPRASEDDEMSKSPPLHARLPSTEPTSHNTIFPHDDTGDTNPHLAAYAAKVQPHRVGTPFAYEVHEDARPDIDMLQLPPIQLPDSSTVLGKFLWETCRDLAGNRKFMHQHLDMIPNTMYSTLQDSIGAMINSITKDTEDRYNHTRLYWTLQRNQEERMAQIKRKVIDACMTCTRRIRNNQKAEIELLKFQSKLDGMKPRLNSIAKTAMEVYESETQLEFDRQVGIYTFNSIANPSSSNLEFIKRLKRLFPRPVRPLKHEKKPKLFNRSFY